MAVWSMPPHRRYTRISPAIFSRAPSPPVKFSLFRGNLKNENEFTPGNPLIYLISYQIVTVWKVFFFFLLLSFTRLSRRFVDVPTHNASNISMYEVREKSRKVEDTASRGWSENIGTGERQEEWDRAGDDKDLQSKWRKRCWASRVKSKTKIRRWEV